MFDFSIAFHFPGSEYLAKGIPSDLPSFDVSFEIVHLLYFSN